MKSDVAKVTYGVPNIALITTHVQIQQNKDTRIYILLFANKEMTENNDKILIAPKEKGFTIFRGDTARLEDDKIKGTLYKIGESLRPSITRSWTTSHKKAKEFACQYAEGTTHPIVPIIYHGIAHRLKKGLFWEPEREVFALRDKSRLKKIEIIERKDCEQIMKELRMK